MSELRAPDPTLSGSTTVVDGDGYVTHVPEDHDHASVAFPELGRPGIACVAAPTHHLGRHDRRNWFIMDVAHAMYVAVPCRECFPDAPPPGHTRSCFPNCNLDPAGLAWQVTSR